MAATPADLAATRLDLEDTRTKLKNETERANRSVAKWEADKAALGRAKDALAVVLGQIEETENRAP